jgi:hypothetical protein
MSPAMSVDGLVTHVSRFGAPSHCPAGSSIPYLEVEHMRVGVFVIQSVGSSGPEWVWIGECVVARVWSRVRVVVE